MIAEFFAGLGEQLHLTAMAQRRQRKAALARPGEGIEPRLPRDAELPLELFVIRFEIVVTERPVDDIVAGEIRLGALGVAAGDFIAVNLEVAGHVARRLSGPMQQSAAQHVQGTRAILQVGFLSGLFPRRRRLMAHPLELLGTDEKPDRVARRVVFFLRRRAALKAHHFQPGGGQLLGHDAAHAADADNTNIRDGIRHAISSPPWCNPPPPARCRRAY